MSDPANAAFLAAVRASRERTEFASSIYDALLTQGEASAHRVTVYRCEMRRCTLLDLIDTPEGMIVGFPRYKTSVQQTEQTSSESGRRANTEDGYRRWKRHAAFVEHVSNPPLSCDDLHNVPLSDEAIRADLEARHSEVLVRKDGTRYAVR